MYSVGDLIDRGDKSLECLELIYETWFHSIYANHEQLMIEALIGNNENMLDSWIYNGGMWKYSHDSNFLKDISQHIVDKIPYIRVIGKNSDKRVNIVHAELYQNIYTMKLFTDEDIDDWQFKNQEDNLVWGRRIIEMKQYYSKIKRPELSITYCGHTPVEIPIQIMNHRYIDTGAVFAVTKQLDRVMTIVDIQDEVVYTMNMKSKELKSFKWNN
jgi:serine/threonine protein phosphatase 1